MTAVAPVIPTGAVTAHVDAPSTNAVSLPPMIATVTHNIATTVCLLYIGVEATTAATITDTTATAADITIEDINQVTVSQAIAIAPTPASVTEAPMAALASVDKTSPTLKSQTHSVWLLFFSPSPHEKKFEGYLDTHSLTHRIPHHIDGSVVD